MGTEATLLGWLVPPLCVICLSRTTAYHGDGSWGETVRTGRHQEGTGFLCGFYKPQLKCTWWTGWRNPRACSHYVIKRTISVKLLKILQSRLLSEFFSLLQAPKGPRNTKRGPKCMHSFLYSIRVKPRNNSVSGLYSFLWVATTRYRRWDGWKQQKCFASQSWRVEVQNQGVRKAMQFVSQALREEPPGPTLASALYCQSLVFIGLAPVSPLPSYGVLPVSLHHLPPWARLCLGPNFSFL